MRVGRTVLLSSRRAPDASLSQELTSNDPVVVACDPLAYLEGQSFFRTIRSAHSFVEKADCDAIDDKAYRLYRELLGGGPSERQSGLNVAHLMSRSILFRLISFEKSAAIAARLMEAASEFILIGDPRDTPGVAYPPEFGDLHEIVALWAEAVGVRCNRLIRSAEVARPEDASGVAERLVLTCLEALLRFRARRVLTVGLYGDLRKRLAALLPNTAVLPHLVAGPPLKADADEADNLASRWIESAETRENEQLPESIIQLRSRAIRDVLRAELPAVIHHARRMESTLRRFRPQVVVLMEDVSPIGRVLAKLARSSGAWTLLIQHGFVGEDLWGTIAMPSIAHANFAWGTYAAEWQYAHGASEGTQVVGGNPMFDVYRRSDADAVIGQGPAPSQIVFVSQPFAPISAHETEHARLRILLALVPFHDEGIPIAVRPHPADDVPLLRRLVLQAGLTRLEWDSTLGASLARPAIFVTRGSTVALEAMILGKPVVIAAFSERGDRTGLAGLGGALLASDEEGLAKAIRECLTDPSARRRLSAGRARVMGEYLGGLNGMATQCLATEVSKRLPHAPS